MFGTNGGQHILAGAIDHRETYGRHVLERFVKDLSVQSAVDLGAGTGTDLAIVKTIHPKCRTIAVEAMALYAGALQGRANEVIVADIEHDRLPFALESIDLVIANQVLEHTKEVFWIFDQTFRSLKIGGYFFVGVPNVASFHNRLLLLAGIHPTQHKLCSAHVRPFSKNDTAKFLSICFPGCSIVRFGGAQFYPFPKTIARLLANAFPSLAFSIFFLIRKNSKYSGEFARYPRAATLETNFWCGEGQPDY